jgi:PAS domain S-box-containing protein
VLRFNRRFAEMWGGEDPLPSTEDGRVLLERAIAAVVDPVAFLAHLADRVPPAGTPDQIDEVSLKDGRTFERRTSAVTGDDGTSWGRMMFFRDVSRARRAEAALRASEERLKLLLGCANGIAFEFNEAGVYLNVWTNSEPLLARPRAELLGRTIIEVLGEARGRAFDELVRRVIHTGQIESLEYMLEVQGGRRWFLADVIPAPQEVAGERTAFLLTRDITERKAMESRRWPIGWPRSETWRRAWPTRSTTRWR